MNFNEYFNPVVQGKMTDEQYAVLISDRRLFSTVAWLPGVEASTIFGNGLEEFEDGFYYGYIVTRTHDFQEALDIAKKRGWGEEIRGFVTPQYCFKITKSMCN